MLIYARLCYVMLCYTILFCATPYHPMLYSSKAKSFDLHMLLRSEEYDYCYERHNNQQLEEPQHDYEPTDEIDTMQSPRGTTAYTRPPDATSRREPVSLPMPNIPPPALPARTGASLPRFGNSTDQFVPPRPLPKGNAKPIVPPPQVRGPLPNAPPKRLAPQPMGQPYTGHTGRARGKDMPPKPDPSTKPLVGKNPSIMTAADCAESRSSMDELKNRVRKRRENYVVQEIRSKEDSSSGMFVYVFCNALQKRSIFPFREQLK